MPDEAEEAVVAFMHALDPATLREVLRRFEEAFQVEIDSKSSRDRRIALALHQASRILGKSPSVREFKALRLAHLDNGWPEPRTIMRWLGVRSWNGVLVRMGLEPLLDGDTIERGIAPIYTIDEVIQALRDCASDLGHPPFETEYFAWQRRPEVKVRPGRRPAANWVFQRIFGGFGPARVAAGLAEDDETAAHPTDVILRTANYRVTNEQIVDDIRYVATRTKGHLTATAYDRERRRVYEETLAVGHPRALASVGTIQRHYFRWPAALEAAGVDRMARADEETRRYRVRFSKTAMFRALAEADEALEGRLAGHGYTAWRAEELEGDKNRRAALPSITTIHRRFRGWTTAVNEMDAWRRSSQT